MNGEAQKNRREAAGRQPLKIDKLPRTSISKIQEKRSVGWTWAEIESDSQTWKEALEKVDAKTAALFPGGKLPHSNLSRWYDLRVEQVKQEVMAKAQRAREFAEAFASRGFKDLPEAVRAALADTIFGLMEDPSKKQDAELRYNLIELGKLLAKERKLDIDEKKVEIEKQKLQQVQVKVKGLKDAVDKKKLDPKELGKKLDEIYGLTS
jgi:hypothetical protein